MFQMYRNNTQIRWRHVWLVIVFVWTFFIAYLLNNQNKDDYNKVLESAKVESRASYNKDLTYRRWAALHGGLYVPITEKSQPNKYLVNIPERDIETPSGKKLTLVNPAYMTRQVHELADLQYGVKGHITSLKPIRPENKPDPWEAKALRLFEEGTKQVQSVESIDGEGYLRAIYPMIPEEPCLKCHASQGYKAGDIRGGLSVSVPLKPYLDIYNASVPKRMLHFALIWILGVAGIIIVKKKIRQQINTINHNLSESKLVSEKLAHSESRLLQIAENSEMWIWEVDTNGLYTYCSQACEFLLGYSVEEVVGKKYFYDFFHPDDKEELKSEAFKVILLKQPFKEFQNRNVNRVGELVWLSTSGVPMVGNNGELLGYRGADIDITERKKLLEEHGRAAQLAALGTVAAGVAHEINNPINGIINYADLLKAKPDDHNRVLDLSKRISKESERIAKITKDLLHYSKDSRNEMKPVNMKELIEEALSLIVPKIRPSGISVEVSLPDSLPSLKVNPQSIQQIIINLVDNAYDALRYKAVPVDQKIIKVACNVVGKNEQSKLCIEVTDNGIGMPQKVVNKAKDAFFSTKPSSEGTGLGLSIVNEIVGKHHGEFDIESKEGEYTKVKILLPFTGNVS